MSDVDKTDPDLEPVEAVYDALDAGAPAEALELTRRALAGGAEDDPVLHFLAGVALLELDSPEDAVTELSRACEIDPDDPEFRSRLAEAQYCACRFDDAENAARLAVEADDRNPYGHWMLGLLLERRGRFDDADRELNRAASLASEDFAPPVRLSREEFELHLAAAIEALPAAFRRHLDEVGVTVADLPSDEILLAGEPPLDPELLGLFVGVPLTERSSFSPGGEMPPRILLFKRNLERHAVDAEELRDEIAVTLRHELGHFLGLDEDEIERTGHG
jgi:predicted Zn-dependent protease with MMP-like domain